MNAQATPCATEPRRETPRAVVATPAASTPAPNFDRLTRIYRWMEWASFGPLLWWCRCAFLAEMRSRRRALIIGDGDGRFTARLLRANRAIQIDAVDASPAMLHALTRRAGANAARVHTICTDARQFQLVASCDLIATHFFLDCLSTAEIETLAKRLRASAAPNVLWVISEFAIPKGWFGSLVARPIVAGLYWAFGLLTGLRQRRLPNHAAALRAAGFELSRRKTWLCGLLAAELWQAGDMRA